MEEQAFYYFKAHHNEIVQNHYGEFVVIKGNEVLGYYPEIFKAFKDMADRKQPAGSYDVYKCTTSLPRIEVASVWTR